MIAAYKDYYKILGLARNADQDEVRVAYRKLARRFHPDVADNKEAGEEIFKEINEAYEILSHPEKRKKYCRSGNPKHSNQEFDTYTNRSANNRGSNQPQTKKEKAPSSHAKGYNFEDYAGGFFDTYDNQSGSSFRHREPNRRSRGFNTYEAYAQPGHDIELDVTISLREVVIGVDRPISVTHTDPLTGELSCSQIHLRVNPGLQEGQIICLSGKGNASVGGGRRGDLILRVRFARNTEFRVRGLDLFRELQIGPWAALFGGNAKVRTVTGSVSLRIPPRIRDGQSLRVRGRGLVGDQGRSGDLYVRISHRFRLEPVAKTLSLIRRKMVKAH
ncbi:MAG: DnaJ domain-containing protein [Verrucomicrobia bacterium]|nr:DnaJ domain-containing protein [Verrucomicrobiota bacterium]